MLFTMDDVIPMVITITLPTANQHCIVFDTTQDPTLARIANAASAQAPGPLRNMFAGYRWKGAVKCTTQNVTMKCELMTDPSLTTSSAFEEDVTATSSGSVTITAGTTTLLDWLPRTGDARVRIVAGATAPDDLDITLMLVRDTGYGA
jgi:hypothetical protein